MLSNLTLGERHILHPMLYGLPMYCHCQLKIGDTAPPLQYVSEVMARAKDEGKRVDTMEKMITTIRDTRWKRKRDRKKANKSFIFHSSKLNNNKTHFIKTVPIILQSPFQENFLFVYHKRNKKAMSSNNFILIHFKSMVVGNTKAVGNWFMKG
jgi:hypothetical protein